MGEGFLSNRCIHQLDDFDECVLSVTHHGMGFFLFFLPNPNPHPTNQKNKENMTTHKTIQYFKYFTVGQLGWIGPDSVSDVELLGSKIPAT